MQIEAKGECLVIVHRGEFHYFQESRQQQAEGLVGIVIAAQPCLVIKITQSICRRHNIPSRKRSIPTSENQPGAKFFALELTFWPATTLMSKDRYSVKNIFSRIFIKVKLHRNPLASACDWGNTTDGHRCRRRRSIQYSTMKKQK